MFGISFEHLIIVGVILLFVGPKRLPELGNTLGKSIKNFKDSFAGIEEASFKRLDTTASTTETPNQDAATQTKSETHPKVPPVQPS